MNVSRWEFEAFVRRFDKRIVAPRTYRESLDLFNAAMHDAMDDPAQLRGTLYNSFYPPLALRAVTTANSEPDVSLAAIHLIWRLLALRAVIYIELLERKLKQNANARIRPNSLQDVNDMLFLSAAATVFGMQDAATYFARYVQSIVQEPNSRRLVAKAFCTGPVEPYLFNLCARYHGYPERLPVTQVGGRTNIFSAIEDKWDKPGLAELLQELLDLKCAKMWSNSAANDLIFGLNTGVNFFLPFETLFTCAVLKHEDVKVSLPRHPLTDVEACERVSRFSGTGANQHITMVLEKCTLLLPGLVIPWEHRFKSSPGSELSDIL